MACSNCDSLLDRLEAVKLDREKWIDATVVLHKAWKIEKDRSDALELQLNAINKLVGRA